MAVSILLALVRFLAVAVTGALVSVGSAGLGLAVMTQCTNTTSQCAAPEVILLVGWFVQGIYALLAASLWLPAVSSRMTRPTLGCLAVAVPFVASAVFLGTGWAASNSYCLDRQSERDYCDIEAGARAPRSDFVALM